VRDRSEYLKQYRIDHREEARVYNAAWHEAHPEYRLAYRASHRDEIRSSGNAYYSAHREERRAYNLAWRETNRDSILERGAKESAEFTEWLQILRTNNGCEDYGTHEGRLEHHHVDPSTKKFNVSEMYGYSREKIDAEIAKCVVLCAACHRKRHVELRALAA